MNRDELTSAVAAKTGLSKKEAVEIVDATLATIMDAIRDGDKVAISGFGTFILHQRAARKARNPKTGESVDVPLRKVPKFVPGKEFKEMAK